MGIEDGPAAVNDGRQRGKREDDEKQCHARQPAENIQNAFEQFVETADARLVHERTHDPIRFEVVDRDAAGHFLVERGHGDDLQAALLRVQNPLEGDAAHDAHDADDHIRNLQVFDHLQQLFAIAKDRITLAGLSGFVAVIVQETDELERRRTHLPVQMRQRASRLARADDQDAALESRRSVEADVEHAPAQGQERGEQQEGAHDDARQGGRVAIGQEDQRVQHQSQGGRHRDAAQGASAMGGDVRVVNLDQENDPQDRQNVKPERHFGAGKIFDRPHRRDAAGDQLVPGVTQPGIVRPRRGQAGCDQVANE